MGLPKRKQSKAVGVGEGTARGQVPGEVWWNCSMAPLSGFVTVCLTGPKSRHPRGPVVVSAMQTALYKNCNDSIAPERAQF